MTTVITYGTFDLFHIGHLRLLERLGDLGDRVIVGVSTDEFNAGKGKNCVVPWQDRADIVRAIKGVDLVIPEDSWDQKRSDIVEHEVDIFAIGNDWAGKFDDLADLCRVEYLPRTTGISTSSLKEILRVLDPKHVEEMQDALSVVSRLLDHYRDLT